MANLYIFLQIYCKYSQNKDLDMVVHGAIIGTPYNNTNIDNACNPHKTANVGISPLFRPLIANHC